MYHAVQQRIQACVDERRERLDISYLQLKKLPEDVAECAEHLERLVVKGWQLNGLLEVQDFLGDLTHLTYLDLSFNELKELPSAIGNLRKLQVLFINLCSANTDRAFFHRCFTSRITI